MSFFSLLADIVNADIIVDKIGIHGDGNGADNSKTDLYLHAVNSSNHFAIHNELIIRFSFFVKFYFILISVACF